MSNSVICPQCGHNNSHHRITCKKCHVNLAEAISAAAQFSAGVIPDEAWGIWEQAAQLIEQPNTNETDLRNAASFLFMAIDASSVPFPEAHALLALVAYRIGDGNTAIQHADIALKYDRVNYMAQSVRVFIAGDELKAFNAGTFLRSESLMDLAIGGLAYKNVRQSQDRLRKEIEAWLNIFSTLSQDSNYTCGDYLWMGSEIVAIADNIPAQKTGLVDIVRKMYNTVGEVRVENLLYQEKEDVQEAKRLNLLARGRTRM